MPRKIHFWHIEKHKTKATSKYFSCYPRTRFCVSQSVMMVSKHISTPFGNNIKRMASFSPLSSGCHTGTIERVVGVVHLIYPKDCLQTVFIECLVVCNKGQSFNERLNSCPYFREYIGIIGICTRQSMYALAE